MLALTATPNSTAALLLALTVVVIAARIGGRIAVRMGQPDVIGEIIVGILLGPTLLGAVWPEAMDTLFDSDAQAGLMAIAQVGLVLFMFLAGLEVDRDRVRRMGGGTALIAQSTIIVPFIVGVVCGLLLHQRFSVAAGPAEFAAFMGIAMAVTALPVLLRILRHVGLAGTDIGAVVTTSAAANDVVAWCVLAGVIAVVDADGPFAAIVTLVLAAVFVLVMLKVVEPIVVRRGAVPFAAAVAIALGSAWVAEVIGIHAIFGAFIAGVVLQRSQAGRESYVQQLEKATMVVLLPVFFVVAGLSTRIDRLDSLELWGVTLLLLLAASVGKIGGGGVAARLVGMTAKDSVTIGVLMNTRGLTEIVILTVGFERGIIDEELFAIMVVVALVTTLAATPILRLAGVGRAEGASGDNAYDHDAPR